MFDLQTLISFSLATAIFAYMPGPATLYASAQTLARGRRNGLLAAAGLHLGGYVHVVAAASGLAVLFELMPVVYSGFKFVGAAYLVWLGVKFFANGASPEESVESDNAPSDLRLIGQSAIVEILNPKTAVFFLAFLPQFTDPASAYPLWGQFLVLGALVNIAFSSADLIYVFFAAQVSSVLKRSPKAGRLASQVGGSVLIGLGVHLAFSK